MASGRSGTGAAVYRRNRATVLANDDTCALCQHAGAKTADHIVPDSAWPRLPNGKRAPGFDAVANLQPAHGTMGNGRIHNPCPTCGRLCNQSKGDRIGPPSPRSQEW